jgi:hypothetical protein
VDLAGASELLEDAAVENPSDERPNVAKPPQRRGNLSFLPFSNPIISYSMAAAILLIAVGASWVVINNWRKQTQPQPGNVYVVSLTPGLTRGSGEITKLIIPPKSDDVRLQLPLPDNQYQSYKAVLQDSNGDILLTKNNLKAQSINGRPALLVDVAPNVIPSGDYRITISGLTANGNSESVSNFSFRVLSK